ncbi:MAG: SDR family NAD(P)-dependent oxidoreductase [Moraxellaceae bacterium]|nr:MAG: SDR family NAD(P)-dependent oxidoreductase [Moraxellaceae bacterium]
MRNKDPQPPVVLVTGASSGIGYYCAIALRNEGYKVIASCRRLEDVEHLRKENIESFQMDLSDSDSVQRGVVEFFNISNGEIYALFNNGAYGQPGAVEDLTREALRKQFETNVFGWCELTNLLLPKMISQGFGRIIQNSSVLGLVAMPMRGAYIGSKFAIEGISDTLRLELKGTGVHVTLIEPGPIRSLFRKNALRAFEENVDIDKSRHKVRYEVAINRLKKNGDATRFTMDPDAVFKKLLHALESRSPRARYYVTIPTYVLGFLKRFLSAKMLDKILSKASD